MMGLPLQGHRLSLAVVVPLRVRSRICIGVGTARSRRNRVAHRPGQLPGSNEMFTDPFWRPCAPCDPEWFAC